MELFSIQIKLGINLNAKQLGLRCFLTGLPQDRISKQPDVGGRPLPLLTHSPCLANLLTVNSF